MFLIASKKIKRQLSNLIVDERIIILYYMDKLINQLRAKQKDLNFGELSGKIVGS